MPTPGLSMGATGTVGLIADSTVGGTCRPAAASPISGVQSSFSILPASPPTAAAADAAAVPAADVAAIAVVAAAERVGGARGVVAAEEGTARRQMWQVRSPAAVHMMGCVWWKRTEFTAAPIT